MAGSQRASRWTTAVTLLGVAAALLGGCASNRAEVWVRNQTDRAYALLLPVDLESDAVAFVEIPPLSHGLAHQRAGQHLASFVLFTADCRPVAGGAIKQQHTALIIDDHGVEIRPDDGMVVAWPLTMYRDLPDCRARLG